MTIITSKLSINPNAPKDSKINKTMNANAKSDVINS